MQQAAPNFNENPHELFPIQRLLGFHLYLIFKKKEGKKERKKGRKKETKKEEERKKGERDKKKHNSLSFSHLGMVLKLQTYNILFLLVQLNPGIKSPSIFNSFLKLNFVQLVWKMC